MKISGVQIMDRFCERCRRVEFGRVNHFFTIVFSLALLATALMSIKKVCAQPHEDHVSGYVESSNSESFLIEVCQGKLFNP
jgi:hypothetical protein